MRQKTRLDTKKLCGPKINNQDKKNKQAKVRQKIPKKKKIEMLSLSKLQTHWMTNYEC